MAKMTALQAEEMVAREEAFIAGARQNLEAKARMLTKEAIDSILVTPPTNADIYHSADTYTVVEVYDVIMSPYTSGYIAYASMECRFVYDSFDEEFRTHRNSEESTNLEVVLTGTIQDEQFYINTIFAEQTPDQACATEGESIAEEEG